MDGEAAVSGRDIRGFVPSRATVVPPNILRVHSKGVDVLIVLHFAQKNHHGLCLQTTIALLPACSVTSPLVWNNVFPWVFVVPYE